MIVIAPGSVRLVARGPGDEDQQLRRLCTEFESILLNQILRQMRRSIPRSGFLDAGPGGELFGEFFDAELARETAKGGGLGLAGELYRQLSAIR